MIDEDFNRAWGRLDQPATTRETKRAQVVQAVSSSAPISCSTCIPCTMTACR